MSALGAGNMAEHKRSNLVSYFNLDMSNFFRANEDSKVTDPFTKV